MITEMEFDAVTKRNIDTWLNGDFDPETKQTIQHLYKENPQELVDAFYTNLSFGTGGLRGLMGVGTNRMNTYTVSAATQGLANYLLKSKPASELSVIIGFDSRNNSRAFSEDAAKVLAANGITVFLFSYLRPTPLVSYALRKKKCSAGIVITASHNPPEYNGYKVYWSDGAQILPPHDKGIIQEVENIHNLSQIKTTELSNPLIHFVDHKIDQEYRKDTFGLQMYPEDNKAHGKELSVVFSNLHGTGITMVPGQIDGWGFKTIHYVEEQLMPNGKFPTVSYPNPEEPEALELGIKLMLKLDADLLIATDPDTDRVGVAVNHRGKAEILNGNQIACLCVAHVCEALTKQKRMPGNAAFIKTIATTELFKAIVESYHKPCFDVLTGFKYVAELINQWEDDPKGYQFIFGGEESYGYLLGTMARDKDAIISSALICEMALQAKLKKKTLVDLLHDIFRQYGIYTEKLLSVKFPETKEGKERMAKGVAYLQNNPPKTFAGVSVDTLEDYKRSVRTDLKTGQTTPIALPKTNCLVFWLSDGSKLMVRPSGTEPKIKIYCGIVTKQVGSIEEAIQKGNAHADLLMTELKKQLETT